MEIKEIIQRIEYFRNKRNLSARELSLSVGKNDSYITQLIKTEFNLSTKMLMEIISALDVSEEEFFAKNYRTYYIDRELYDAIIKLPEDKKYSLSNFLKK